MKRCCLILALALFAPAVFAAELPRLAVMEIKARRGVDPQLALVVEEFLVNEMASSEKYEVVGRDDIARMLDHETQKQLHGCEEDTCLAEIGGAMGVDGLVAGSLDRVGESVLISLKLIDVKTGEVKARVSERLRGGSEEEALDAVTVLVDQLLKASDGKLDLPKMVLTEIHCRRGVDETLGKVVEEYLAGEIAATGAYSVIGQDDIERLIDHESQKQLLGCEADADSCLAEIGGALGAEKLLAGSMDRVGKSILISLKVIDVVRAKVERRESERLRGATEEDALDALSKLFGRMFKTEVAAARERRKALGLPVDEEPPPKETVAAEPAPDADSLTPDAARARFQSSRKEEGGGQVWSWVTLAIGVAAVGAGVAMEVLANMDYDEMDSLIADNRDGEEVGYSAVDDLHQSGFTKDVAGITLLGVGGALTVVSIILFFVEGDDADARAAVPAVRPLITAEAGGLLFGGRF